MTLSRRPVLAGLALAMLGGPAFAGVFRMEEVELYGMIGKMKAQPGKRAELVALLTAGTADMPGCLAYIVCEDLKEPDVLWITEIWKTKQYHDDSLKLPAVRDAIAKGRPLIAGFEMGAEVKPVGGIGIKG
ncbi:antibiotic biosynthesis monooxygenase [Sphingomonas sp. R-74633]|uniref:putative quinol monooxygenase n=1 Tax=Sphingomonas sp. R-74633 TaxID=2751188 RepID=UPI0015D3598C|nr:putative quinol monooxygenase [Sphingomonas sp. R-74633]NYT39918.1 antibiotic biosynthesis monooxygenase [Sphingomonas sp. R-74633]